MNLWFNGPIWMQWRVDQWPKAPLKCLSQDNKSTLVNYQSILITVQPSIPIFDCSKYSSFQKILKITACVYKFISKCQKIEADAWHKSKLYWIKHIQKECFFTELAFLQKETQDKNIQSLSIN